MYAGVQLGMDIIFNMKCVISMKQFTFSLIIFVTIVSDLFSNIIEQNLDKLKFYHHKLIAGGQMEVTIYRGELNKSEADSLLKSFSEIDVYKRQLLEKVRRSRLFKPVILPYFGTPNPVASIE